MYLIEGPSGNATSGFENIPNSIYWAIVTLTTVGYGTVVPATAIGKFFASIIMLFGYGIIAVPTGIVASAVTKIDSDDLNYPTLRCSKCLHRIHKNDKFCANCGSVID